MNRYVCIHGHFYQPPRENPWLEKVEVEHSAYPYHDWNERITAECYLPNSTSQILDKQNRIIDIVDNYSRISFNFGPTLLTWLQEQAPDAYGAIIAADKKSQQYFSGHGSALAQAYNHLILPLANRRDKYTQVLWGIREFEHRFGLVPPEGMWLPETAVDSETLDIMAELGIKFTILAPRQASHVRKIGSEKWLDFTSAPIDTTKAYQVPLKTGRKLAVFFYNGQIAHAVAFQGLLKSGEEFANHLVNSLPAHGQEPQLANVATDGESYGHHHRFGDMALAFALRYIETNQLAKITNYAEFLATNPPQDEVKIIENTSWSCAHGVERWRSNCGCNAGRNPAWNQEWRAPLRKAFDWLRDDMITKFEETAVKTFKDPWQARNNYIDVILDRSPENINKFLTDNTARQLNQEETVTALKLMELQRQAMLMYTSCGWFFDELSGFETLQVMQYAGRMVELASELFGDSTERKFMERMALAKSNLIEYHDGSFLYEKFIKSEMVNADRIGANYIMNSYYRKGRSMADSCCSLISEETLRSFVCGNIDVKTGRLIINSPLTLESKAVDYLSIQSSQKDITIGVKAMSSQIQNEMNKVLTGACADENESAIVRAMETYFGSSVFSFGSLFRDVQYDILQDLLLESLNEVSPLYHQLHYSNYPLMRFVIDQGIPFPGALRSAFDFVLNTSLRKALEQRTPDTTTIKHLLDDARIWNVTLDGDGLGYDFSRTLINKMAEFSQKTDDSVLLDILVNQVELTRTLPFQVNLHRLQSNCFQILKTVYPAFKERANLGDQIAWDWVNKFTLLCDRLNVKVN